MATQLNVEILNRETIKPSFPTPNQNKTFRFSVLDQYAHVGHVGLLLFFSRTNSCKTDHEINHSSMVAERSKLLKKSLSQTLTSFYPLAGRRRDNVGIDCNDEGAEFLETRVRCPLSSIMEKPDCDLLRQLIPSTNSLLGTCPLLLVQANFFECGGMVIGVSLSHKAAEASTICTFLNCWAANTSGSAVSSSLSPQFFSQPLFPPHALLASLPKAPAQPFPPHKIALRRLVFRGPKVSALRSKLASPTVPNPTRVESVVALIWKYAMEASSRCNSTELRQSAFFQAVNLRKRLVPALPETSCGNLSWSYTVLCKAREADLQDLVAMLRKGIEEFNESCDIRVQWENLSRYADEKQNIESRETDVYRATSWCRFPFYGVDFGWGNPSWVCVPDLIGLKNAMMLIDARDNDDGVEVLLSLGEEEMALFEQNPKVLEFASFDLITAI